MSRQHSDEDYAVCVVGSASVTADGVADVLRRGGASVRVERRLDAAMPADAVVLGPTLSRGDLDRLTQAGLVMHRTVLLVAPASPTGLRALARGAACIGPAMSPERVLEVVRQVAAGRPGGSAPLPLAYVGRVLTRRQAEVLALAAQGRSTSEIADDLVISQRTVRNTFSASFAALGVRDRCEAVAWAWSTGWIHDTGPPPIGRP